jgi:hypothetical protein
VGGGAGERRGGESGGRSCCPAPLPPPWPTLLIDGGQVVPEATGAGSGGGEGRRRHRAGRREREGRGRPRCTRVVRPGRSGIRAGRGRTLLRWRGWKPPCDRGSRPSARRPSAAVVSLAFSLLSRLEHVSCRWRFSSDLAQASSSTLTFLQIWLKLRIPRSPSCAIPHQHEL